MRIIDLGLCQLTVDAGSWLIPKQFQTKALLRIFPPSLFNPELLRARRVFANEMAKRKIA